MRLCKKLGVLADGEKGVSDLAWTEDAMVQEGSQRRSLETRILRSS
jgi:hypothetical protein